MFELLIVIAMVAILSTIAYPVFIGVLERGKALKDMNNLRQIGVVTQLYMNDNDNVIFSSDPSAGTWMSQLRQKYLSAWNVFQSPLDIRAPSELGDVTTPISYGINQNVAGTGLLATKIVIPSGFILFAPAQDSVATVEFQGTAATAVPGVTVVGIGGSPPPPAPPLPAKAKSIPGGDAIGGTHSSRKQINALFADWHAENMLWTTFTNNPTSAVDPDYLRWHPYTPYP